MSKISSFLPRGKKSEKQKKKTRLTVTEVLVCMLELWWLAWALCVVLPSKGLRLGALIPGRKFCSCVWELTEPPVVPGGAGCFSGVRHVAVTPFCSAMELACERPGTCDTIPAPEFPPWDVTGEESWPSSTNQRTLLNYCSKKASILNAYSAYSGKP